MRYMLLMSCATLAGCATLQDPVTQDQLKQVLAETATNATAKAVEGDWIGTVLAVVAGAVGTGGVVWRQHVKRQQKEALANAGTGA